jgi:isoleucyl-tRNA synthetase
VLDLTMNVELIEEGLVREFVSKVQNLRREMGFEVTDHIEIRLHSEDKGVEKALLNNASAICADVLANNLSAGSGNTVLDINGIDVQVCIEKA